MVTITIDTKMFEKLSHLRRRNAGQAAGGFRNHRKKKFSRLGWQVFVGFVREQPSPGRYYP